MELELETIVSSHEVARTELGSSRNITLALLFPHNCWLRPSFIPLRLLQLCWPSHHDFLTVLHPTAGVTRADTHLTPKSTKKDQRNNSTQDEHGEPLSFLRLLTAEWVRSYWEERVTQRQQHHWKAWVRVHENHISGTLCSTGRQLCGRDSSPRELFTASITS